jgi:uncharacterized protein involved in exopolysaccharide biosynthesis
MTAMNRTPNTNSHDTTFTSDSAQPSRSFQSDIEINPVEFIRLLKRNRRLIAAVVVGVMVLTAAAMVFTSNRYRSHASILPSGSRDRLSGLMDIAGQFGVGSLASADENSSALYPSILHSDLVCDGVLKNQYEIMSGGDHRAIQLPEYFATDDPTELRLALSEITSVGEDKKLGIIRMGVETTDPKLSQAILEEYLSQLETYLRVKRRSQARENETYLTDQRALRSIELTQAEDSLQQFMKVNRNWTTSSDPQLQTELARLRREVELQAKTYLLLFQQLELARLEVQKDIPIVRVLDEPSLPTKKSGPRRTLTTLLAGCLAFLVVISWLFVRDLWRQGMAGVDDNSDAGEDSDDRSRSGQQSRLLNLVRRSDRSPASRTGTKQPIEHG